MAGVLALVAGWALLLVLAVAALVAIVLASRRILLGRTGGTVECGLRATRAAPWRLGLAAYKPDQLYWFSAFGLRLRPQEAFDRRSLSVLARRPAVPAEVISIGAGTVVVECQTEPREGGRPRQGARAGEGGRAENPPAPRTVELAMSEAALTGFLAWLESSPPGHVSGLS
ncbi:MAG TPA: DUF2550 domain-containing protein [Streptosporangiaceae bacterium]|nr:DUF2550 domain-containing protein [Streptosporangiaceae bacterium]